MKSSVAFFALFSTFTTFVYGCETELGCFKGTIFSDQVNVANNIGDSNSCVDECMMIGKDFYTIPSSSTCSCGSIIIGTRTTCRATTTMVYDLTSCVVNTTPPPTTTPPPPTFNPCASLVGRYKTTNIELLDDQIQFSSRSFNDCIDTCKKIDRTHIFSNYQGYCWCGNNVKPCSQEETDPLATAYSIYDIQTCTTPLDDQVDDPACPLYNGCAKNAFGFCYPSTDPILCPDYPPFGKTACAPSSCV